MPERIRVLHVEDDVEVASAIALLLRAAGFAVTTATTAEQAMHYVAATALPPDVLLLDYWLGDSETGADLAEHIASALGHRVPTIILTGQLFNAEVPWMPGTPMMLASKPMDGEMLIETIAHFAALHRYALARATPRALGPEGQVA
jgi:DNA-binding NtrC family response regulator